MKTNKFWKDIFEKISIEANVILEILDARNPIGTRIFYLEDYIEKNFPEKQIILVLNKIDLIPQNVLNDWIDYFRKTTKYQLFYLSAKYNKGIIYFKSHLKKVLKEGYSTAIIVGYPNTGKSTLINALKKKAKHKKDKVVLTSPRAGFTRGLTEIKIGEGIYIYDTPGIIPFSEKDDVDQAIKGIIAPEKVINKDIVVLKIINNFVGLKEILRFFEIDKNYILELPDSNRFSSILQKLEYKPLQYKNEKYENKNEFLENTNLQLNYDEFQLTIELIARKKNFLIKGGVIDENRLYTKIIQLWQSNKIKFYTISPKNSN